VRDVEPVVVIGGGMLGLSVAYHLARAGVRDVTVLEARELASGTTSQAATHIGQLRGQELWCRSIMGVVAQLRDWTTEHGDDVGFHQVGSLKVALSDDRVRELETHVALARKWGLDVDMIEPRKAQERVPLLDTTTVRACAWIPSDAYAEPYSLATSVARLARRLGVKIRTRAPVAKIVLRGSRVVEVETSEDTLPATTVVMAVGAWIETLGGALGLRLATIPIRHQLWVTAPMDGVPRDMPIVRIPDLAVYMRQEVGGVLLGGFEERPKSYAPEDLPATIEETERDIGVLEELAGRLVSLFPGLQSARIVRGCAGLPTFTPDGNFLLGPIAQVPGLFVVTGCNAIGIAGALPVGEWMTELILGMDPSLDLSSQRLDRFAGKYQTRTQLRTDCEDIYANFFSLHKGAF
jgi:4-methylaminobutanoate oxidase (formaldehyde-forming)